MMRNTIKVTTQAEFDALPTRFDNETTVEVHGNLSINRQIENVYVEALGSNHVVARGSSHVVAWDSSHVVAWDSSHVVARDSSHVVARDSSHVVAWDSSHVVARGSVTVRSCSSGATVILSWCAICIWFAGKVMRKSGRATVVTPMNPESIESWLDASGIEPINGLVKLYKRVSKDFKTQEGTPQETIWTIGSRIEHPAWKPEKSECGAGKFHACPAPYLCDEFRNGDSDRYVAILVALGDLYHWSKDPQYPNKIGFRAGTVLNECDRYGQPIAAQTVAGAA